MQSLHNLLVTDGLITVLDESGQVLRAPIQILVTQATWSGEILGRLARLQLSGKKFPMKETGPSLTWMVPSPRLTMERRFRPRGIYASTR